MNKVCHISTVHRYNDPRIFAKECSSLAKNGYDVYFVVPNTENALVSGVKIVSFSTKKMSRLCRMLFAVNKAYRMASLLDADIYHLHDPELLRIALKLKRKGKKVVYDSHEFYSMQILERNYIPLLFRKIISNIYSSIEAYVCRRIDAVVQVCSVNGKNVFEGRCRKSIYLPNTPIIDNSRNIELEEYDKVNSVIYVGSLTYQRGISHLVESSLYTNTEIDLVGNFGSEEYKNNIMAKIKKNSVNYLGFIPNNEIQNLLKNRIAGISTLLNVGQYSQIDTLPTKVYEYLLAGIPVILSDTKFNRSFIDKYKCGICVDPSNPKEIANAINHLSNNKEEAYQMGLRGRLAVIDNFNWKLQEKTLLNLYEEIMNCKN